MATDWAADVRKYAPDADDAVIAGIVRHCGIALRTRDTALVAFRDKAELARVRDSLLKKKLGLKHADDVLDLAIEAVGDKMKPARNRNRVTVYYLLAASFGLLDAFAPKPKKPAAATKRPAPAKPAPGKPAAAKPAAAKPAAAKPAAARASAGKTAAAKAAPTRKTRAATPAGAVAAAVAPPPPAPPITVAAPPRLSAGVAGEGGEGTGGAVPLWVWLALLAALLGGAAWLVR